MSIPKQDLDPASALEMSHELDAAVAHVLRAFERRRKLAGLGTPNAEARAVERAIDRAVIAIEKAAWTTGLYCERRRLLPDNRIYRAPNVTMKVYGKGGD
jgi:hypothetical protein